jgi:hypothetical protein
MWKIKGFFWLKDAGNRKQEIFPLKSQPKIHPIFMEIL